MFLTVEDHIDLLDEKFFLDEKFLLDENFFGWVVSSFQFTDYKRWPVHFKINPKFFRSDLFWKNKIYLKHRRLNWDLIK